MNTTRALCVLTATLAICRGGPAQAPASKTVAEQIARSVKAGEFWVEARAAVVGDGIRVGLTLCHTDKTRKVMFANWGPDESFLTDDLGNTYRFHTPPSTPEQPRPVWSDQMHHVYLTFERPVPAAKTLTLHLAAANVQGGAKPQAGAVVGPLAAAGGTFSLTLRQVPNKAALWEMTRPAKKPVKKK